MNLSIFKPLLTLLILLSAIGQVQAEQGCPYPSMIRYVDGHFKSADKQLLWRSPLIETRDFIDLFIGAIFMPGSGQEREYGFMDKCLYRTSSGNLVALRPAMGDLVTNMSLSSTLYWQPDIGPFNQPVFLCQDSQPDNCAFRVNGRLQ
ncbi:DUF3757 domain-containing protein [Pseudomonas poae]|uniref:DUF3757 domain-containing protein n=1 Tax=Pseudomonas poae TaxID=200451 RepID=UPI001612E6AF|nr:DUF3757 domain-containing protein [Pseudomonas poae]